MANRELDFQTLNRGATEGLFARHELPSVLVRVVRQGRTGRLTLTDGTKVRTVGFSGGLPTLAGSQVSSEHFGQRLAKLNLITQDDLARVDALMCREPIQFGAAMVRLGIASTAELRRVLTTHHSWLIAQCLNAVEVSVSFAPFVWVAKDPTSLALLQALEDGVRAYGREEIEALWKSAERYRFHATDDDVELVRRLGAPKSVVGLLEGSRSRPRTLAELGSACEDSDPLVMVLSLALAGLWRAELAPGAVAVEPLAPRSAPAPAAAAPRPVDDARPAAPAVKLPPPAGEGASFFDGLPAGREKPKPKEPDWHRAQPPTVVLSEAKLARWSKRVKLDLAREPVIRRPAWRGVGVMLAFAAAALSILWVVSRTERPVGPPHPAEVAEPELLAAPPRGVRIISELATPSAAASEEHVAPQPAPPPATVHPPAASEVVVPRRPRPNGVVAHPAPPPAQAAQPAPEPANELPAAVARTEVEQAVQECRLAALGPEARKAITVCQAVLGKDPRNAQAYRSLGIAYARLSAKAQACESYRRYLRFAPQAPDRAQIEAWLRVCD